MESAFSLERFSAIAADLNYVLLLGQPLPELLCTAWHISSQPAPSVPLILGQRVLLVSPASRTYFGRLKSIVRLEDSYLVVSVSPESSAYGPFIPESCHIHLPPSFILLPWTRRIRETTLRAKPKELPHGTLRRNRTRDLRAKTQRELKWRASGCWIAAVYILHYTCPVRGYPRGCLLYEAVLMTLRDTACTARGCGPDSSTDKTH